MWIEESPKEFDVVKINFAEWTGLGTQIGVCLGYCSSGVKINFGKCIRILNSLTTFYIYK